MTGIRSQITAAVTAATMLAFGIIETKYPGLLTTKIEALILGFEASLYAIFMAMKSQRKEVK